MQVKTIALQAQGSKICTYVALDVFYLANPLSKTFLNNYISIIICQSCKFVSLKPISRISSYNLAQHLYSFVELTGKIPTVLITDSASNNTKEGQSYNLFYLSKGLTDLKQIGTQENTQSFSGIALYFKISQTKSHKYSYTVFHALSDDVL